MKPRSLVSHSSNRFVAFTRVSDVRARQEGVAIIIVLAFVVLLTFVVVAFFSRATLFRQVENSSNARARADILARTAGELVVADLKKEITSVAASDVTGSVPFLTYTPKTATNMVPTRVLVDTSTATNAIYNNLVKQNGGTIVGTGNVGGYVAASTIDTMAASVDGRLINGARWSAPLLLGNATSTVNFTNAQVPRWTYLTRAGLPASQNFATNFRDATTSNTNFVIGRFAFNVYNQGGLLDVNVAGYPSVITASTIGKKGTLGLADLSVIPGVNNQDIFVSKWRNIALSKTLPGPFVLNYLGYLGEAVSNNFYNVGPGTGFLKAASTASDSDNRFLGRQDLIRFARIGDTDPTKSLGISPLALPYLTHFSRELTAPSWGPQQNASAMGGNDGSSSPAPYAYYTNQNNQLFSNRFLPSLRVQTAFRRLTGEMAAVDEPLIKYRFPLSWLALLKDSDPATNAWDLTSNAVIIVNNFDARRKANGGSAIPGGTVNEKAKAMVQQAFGLIWDSSVSQWLYAGSPFPSLGSPTASIIPNTTATSLMRFGPDAPPSDTVVEQNREPNFFELLKAGILSGSLGQGPADNEGTVGSGLHPAYSRAANNGTNLPLLGDFQIIQVGANLIDQSDSDSVPTAIAFNPALLILTGPFLGMENLPYFNKLYTRLYRPSSGFALGAAGPQPAHRPYLRGWLALELWNPAGNASSAPSSSMRIVQTAGTMQLFTNGGGTPPGRKNGATPPTQIPLTSPYTGSKRTSIPVAAANAQVITFTASSSSNFGTPAVLTSNAGSGSATNSLPEGSYSDGGLDWTGFWLGDINEPDFSNPGTKAAIAPLTINDVVNKGSYSAGPEFSEDVVLELQVNSGGSWRPVQRLHRPNWLTNVSSNTFYYFDWMGLNYEDKTKAYVTVGSHPLVLPDPRTQRYGVGILDIKFRTNSAEMPWVNKAPREGMPKTREAFSNGRFLRVANCAPYVAPGSGTWAAPESTGGWHLASLNENLPGSIARVPDVDGVLRVGDGHLATAASFDALGGGANAVSARPIILDRPFRSVGEIGYAFRDQPWKTLDFSSANSADAALLDLFCLNEQPAVGAGRVNLNSASEETLQAIISGVERVTAGANSPISSSQAKTVAASLRTAIKANPMLSGADLVARTAGLPSSDFGTAPEGAIKTRRESVVRALGDSGQTRTWNLLVDLVAQTGRFGQSANSLDKFIVEGERRYWLHVAIDRFTGVVIDQQIESVSE